MVKPFRVLPLNVPILNPHRSKTPQNTHSTHFLVYIYELSSTSMIIVQCPHCGCDVIIEQLNCKIFRHGVFKDSGKQINPHAPKIDCDMYIEKELIYGCGKPFIVLQQSDNSYKAEICDYI